MFERFKVKLGAVANRTYRVGSATVVFLKLTVMVRLGNREAIRRNTQAKTPQAKILPDLGIEVVLFSKIDSYGCIAKMHLWLYRSTQPTSVWEFYYQIIKLTFQY